jgi:hypothetical protein
MKIKSPIGFLALWSAFLAVGTWMLPVGAWVLPIRCAFAIPQPATIDLDQDGAGSFMSVFGVAPSDDRPVLFVAGSYAATDVYSVELDGAVVQLRPRVSAEITEAAEIQAHRLATERVYSVFAEVHTLSGVVMAQFLVRSFEAYSEFWFTGAASQAFTDALMPVEESDLRIALDDIAPALEVTLEGLQDGVLQRPFYDGPQSTSDCARLARRIAICRTSFEARAREAQAGLMEQLELLAELHQARLAACDAEYSAALDQCAQGRGAAILSAEANFDAARAAAESARDIAHAAAAQARSTNLAIAVGAELICVAAAHVTLYACLAAAGWTGAGIPVCITTFLALQALCHAGFIAAVVAIDSAFDDAITLANTAFNQQMSAAQLARDAAVLAADQAYAQCTEGASVQRDACREAAGLEYLAAACLALQAANADFRMAMIQLRECLALAQEEFGDRCPDSAAGEVMPGLEFLGGIQVEGCEFEWPPSLP